MAVVCLHIIAVVYLLVGVMAFWLLNFSADALAASRPGKNPAFSVGLLLFCLAMSAGSEFVVYGLRRRKFWAWVAGLCIFGLGMVMCGCVIPACALGLWGLLDSGSLREFGVSGSTGPV
jgi:hypothetical protein